MGQSLNSICLKFYKHGHFPINSNFPRSAKVDSAVSLGVLNNEEKHILRIRHFKLVRTP